uniref:AlNc14C253G9674 protein n=1 Tax=Albugo laibachii Nc14 TaxID=890382 RepID=F0WTJ5_9STRA|nr:AlNc14C253G9674 [Albugo laibachii Nc14]CCA26368.1 AlNc14C367G11065 [Albugo laibachii Nc14]|eukprot:CCA26368.1 AlNc14C367G11065 [Albugo laibachii Nc14]
MSEKREFVRKYSEYYNTLLVYETFMNKRFVMQVSACINVSTREHILKLDVKRYPVEGTEQDWRNYCRDAQEDEDGCFISGCRIQDKSVRSQVYRVLDQLGLQDYVERMDPKRIVKGMGDVLKPPAFIKRIIAKLDLDIHKAMKKDPIVFCEWCRELLISYMEWEPDTNKSDV